MDITKAPINVAGMLIPQKIYRVRNSFKSLLVLLLFGIVIISLISVSPLIWESLHSGLDWIWVVAVIIDVLLITFGVWVFSRAWNQHLEFTSAGITSYFLFFRIYAPWDNIAAFDGNLLLPIAHGSRGAFIYKNPAQLYVPIRKGKKEHLTVVQLPRWRSRTNPELTEYLTHYLPVFLEAVPNGEIMADLGINRDK